MLLVSLRGGRLWVVGESGFEEGSGDSGGPMLMSSWGRRWLLRDVGGDMLGVGRPVGRRWRRSGSWFLNVHAAGLGLH